MFVIIGIYYFTLLDVGYLRLIDEYHTLDRVLSISRHDEWLAIHTENHISFKKPPLQYWLSAFALDQGLPQAAALRLPSLVSALLLLPVVAFLAYQLRRTGVFAIVLAPLILAGSEQFWSSALSALLDQGSVLLATAALAGAFAALRNPKWWYFVALMCGLSALQKAPVGLIYVLIVICVSRLTLRGTGLSTAQPLLNRHFGWSIVIALILIVSWPILQTIRFGDAYMQVAIGEEMLDRFAPTGSSDQLLQGEWFKGIFRGQSFFEVPGMIAILIGPYFIRRIETYSIFAIFVLYVLATGLAGGHISARYSIYLYPLMAAMLAALLAKYGEKSQFAAVIAIVLVVATLGPFKSADELRLRDSTQSEYVPFLREISGALKADEIFVRCRHNNGRKRWLFPGTISVYASGGKPVWLFKRDEDVARIRAKSDPQSVPLRGICSERDFDKLNANLTGATEISRFRGYIHWRADSLISEQ